MDLLRTSFLRCLIICCANNNLYQRHITKIENIYHFGWQGSSFDSISACSFISFSGFTCPASFITSFRDSFSEAYFVESLWGLYSALGPSWPSNCHMFSLLGQPGTGQGLSWGRLSLKIWSMVSLKASLSMRGMSLPSRGLAHSMQGFSLISISHTLSSSSMMKSRPKSSKQNLRWFWLIFLLTELQAMQVISFIRSHMRSVCSSPMISASPRNDSWFPFSKSPQLDEFFWIALLVRWMKQLWMSRSWNYSADVRMYPSLKKYRLWVWVSNVHTRMSNFRFWIRNGLSTYFWITKEQLLSLKFSRQNLVSVVSSVCSSPGLSSSASFSSFCFTSLLFSVLLITLTSFDGFFLSLSFYLSLLPKFFRFMEARKSMSIFSRSSRLSNISMPLPRFRPVGLSSQTQPGSGSPEQQVALLTGRDRMFTFFLISEFCQAMQGWNLLTKLQVVKPFLREEVRFFLGSFLRKKLRNCFILYSQYSSSKSTMKVTGVRVKISIFLVSQYSCRLRIRLSFVVSSSLNSKWLMARVCVNDHIFLQLCLSFENTHFRCGTPSPHLISFHTLRSPRISRIRSSLLFAFPMKTVSQSVRVTLILASSLMCAMALSWARMLMRWDRLVEVLRFSSSAWSSGGIFRLDSSLGAQEWFCLRRICCGESSGLMGVMRLLTRMLDRGGWQLRVRASASLGAIIYSLILRRMLDPFILKLSGYLIQGSMVLVLLRFCLCRKILLSITSQFIFQSVLLGQCEFRLYKHMCPAQYNTIYYGLSRAIRGQGPRADEEGAEGTQGVVFRQPGHEQVREGRGGLRDIQAGGHQLQAGQTVGRRHQRLPGVHRVRQDLEGRAGSRPVRGGGQHEGEGEQRRVREAAVDGHLDQHPEQPGVERGQNPEAHRRDLREGWRVQPVHEVLPRGSRQLQPGAEQVQRLQHLHAQGGRHRHLPGRCRLRLADQDPRDRGRQVHPEQAHRPQCQGAVLPGRAAVPGQR